MMIFMYGCIFLILCMLTGLLLFVIKKSAFQDNLHQFEHMYRQDTQALRQELTQTLLQFNTSLTSMVEQRLDKLNCDNAQQLEKMRTTVDEKLHHTLEKKLNDSFSLVSERLEKVHQGLGEMQNLAADVGGLKRVLTNVKSRGTWGEVQLEALIAQMLEPHQYQKNVHIKNTQEVVEFAISLPDNVCIPIDSKFPLEDYEKLVSAQEKSDLPQIEFFSSELESKVKTEAKRIKDKYIYPPKTTDFAVLFLPTEGLYAEIIRRPGLVTEIQNKYRVSLCGPTTLCAFLNSLQMGFKTLAIQKYSSEVWKVLAEVKGEFTKYQDWIDKIKRYLDMTSKTLDDADKRTRAVNRRLKQVEGNEEEILKALTSHEHVLELGIKEE